MAKDEDLENDLSSVTKAAERLGLKGRDRKEYIDKHMTGFGYRRKTTYERSDDNDNNGGGFFGRRNRDNNDDDDDL
jgi:hypothetical protein